MYHAHPARLHTRRSARAVEAAGAAGLITLSTRSVGGLGAMIWDGSDRTGIALPAFEVAKGFGDVYQAVADGADIAVQLTIDENAFMSFSDAGYWTVWSILMALPIVWMTQSAARRCKSPAYCSSGPKKQALEPAWRHRWPASEATTRTPGGDWSSAPSR